MQDLSRMTSHHVYACCDALCIMIAPTSALIKNARLTDFAAQQHP